MLDTSRVSLVLPIELLTTDTSKVYSIWALLDCRATGSFIDRNFVCSKRINAWSISCPIPVFNVDRSSNKVGQIMKVVDITLWYNSHLEQMLLVVSNLGKQDLILGYFWLKNHNPKVN